MEDAEDEGRGSCRSRSEVMRTLPIGQPRPAGAEGAPVLALAPE